MSDVDRLLAWFDDGTLVRPNTPAASSVDLSRALASASGVTGLDLAPAAREIGETIAGTDHRIFVLVDGLGMNLIDAQPDGAFLRNHVARELHTVFPAATAAAVTSIGTGLWPGQHAVPGWWTYLPEHELTATILLFIDRFSSKPLTASGIDAPDVFPEPTLLSRYRVDLQTFLPQGIADSVYSRYFSGGTAVQGYETLAGLVPLVADRVSGASAPTYTYIYYPAVDGLQHDFGPEADEVREHLALVDEQLARLHDAAGERAKVIVSADHGVISVPDEAKHVLTRDDALLDLLVVPPSGEPRVPMFHVRDGARERFAAAFRERYGESFALLSIGEAEELELFGPRPLAPKARERLGDFVALAPGPEVLVYAPRERNENVLKLRGYHGGLAPGEMRIPLVVA